MSTDYNFEDVDIPQGTYIGWGPKPGQTATLDVISYQAEGGTDFNDQPCPQVIGTLLAPMASYRDKGTTKDSLEAGTLVTMTCGLANLKRNMHAANPQTGDVLRVSYNDTIEGGKGTIKLFKCEIARGAGTGIIPPAADDGDDDGGF